MKDVIVLVPDKNIEFAIRGIFQRTYSLGITEIRFDIKIHAHRDPGVFKTAHELLRLYVNKYSYALVLLDREGCGRNDAASEIASHLQHRLDESGWLDRSKVIVIDPELEVWVWSDSPEVAYCLGWDQAELLNWLQTNNYILPNHRKPSNPKGVLERALQLKNKPRSSSLFQKIAERVSFDRCEDAAFQTLRQTLKAWFGLPRNRASRVFW